MEVLEAACFIEKYNRSFFHIGPKAILKKKEVFNQYIFLNYNRILDQFQSSFRFAQSTETGLLEGLMTYFKCRRRALQCVAFNTVHHEILYSFELVSILLTRPSQYCKHCKQP